MSYRKGDIPKVTIDRMKIGGKELTEEVANNILNGKFDLGIEKIAKDIVKRQDNAIAMEFTKCIGELLRKNGITPKIKQYGCDFYGENSFSSKYGVIIDELDLSEHDKVFGDKIAELKKDYKTASELLGKYQQENESLKKRVVELENFSCQAEQETESLVEKLKQRIAELESKETEKPTKYTTVIVAKEINGQEYVRLEDFMSVVNDLQAQIGT